MGCPELRQCSVQTRSCIEFFLSLKNLGSHVVVKIVVEGLRWDESELQPRSQDLMTWTQSNISYTLLEAVMVFGPSSLVFCSGHRFMQCWMTWVDQCSWVDQFRKVVCALSSLVLRYCSSLIGLLVTPLQGLQECTSSCTQCTWV